MTRTFNLADLFEIVAEAVPDRIAFICGEKRLSFRELDQRANQIAVALQQNGVQRGDNVGIELFNSSEYLEAFFACCKIGAAPANVNYRYVADELKHLLDSLQLKALFYDASVASEVQQVAPKLSHLKLCIQTGAPQIGVTGAVHYDTLLAAGKAALVDNDRHDNDLYLLCTGGTTGLPKGVVWPHKSLFMSALGGGGIYFQRPPIEKPEDLGPLVASAPPMSFFAIAPMMHGAAMWGTLISLLAGHAVVVNDQHHFDPEHILDITARDQVNIISMVGDAMALPLVKALEAHPGRWNLSHLRVVGNGGALVSAHVQERLKAAIPHIALSNGMGSSETGLMGSGAKPTKGDGFMVLKARPDLAVISETLQILSTPGDTGILARSGYTPVAYFGDATAHASILGVALALAFSLPVVWGAAMVALLMASVVSSLSGRGVAMDTLLGVMAHSALAFGLVAVSFIDGVRIDLMAYRFGDILAVTKTDLAVIWGGAGVGVGYEKEAGAGGWVGAVVFGVKSG